MSWKVEAGGKKEFPNINRREKIKGKKFFIPWVENEPKLIARRQVPIFKCLNVPKPMNQHPMNFRFVFPISTYPHFHVPPGNPNQ
jgi:hypothetical protein